MPVTIKVAKHDATPVRAATHTVKVSQDALEVLNHKDAENIGPILKTAIGPQTSLPDSELNKMRLKIEDHGLVRAAYYAYSGHHHLVIRPEDVWFAILIQFSFYVNANSEKLRKSFVAHKGKKGLILRDPAQADMSVFCRNMTKLIDANIVDPKLREWIMPSFTTTTLNDEVVASIIMMGTLQKYFDYIFDATCCGIPSVTLLGELSDWEDIQRRLEKLNEYGKEPSRFCDMLRPILKFMVASFKDGPGDATVVDFWSRMIDRTCGSGMDYLNGWMVAFCFWDEDGKCLASSLYGAAKSRSLRPLEPLGVPYHTVDFDKVPAGFVSVPVIYIPPEEDVQIETKLLAGFVGYEEITYATHAVKTPAATPVNRQLPSWAMPLGERFSIRQLGLRNAKTKTQPSQEESSQALEATKEPGELDTLKPVTGWWMYEVNKGKKTGKSRKQFYGEQMMNWEGGASTGYVQRDGTMNVEDGLPWDIGSDGDL